MVTATMGPGGTATASTGETAWGAGPVMVASAEAVGTSAGSRGTEPGGELGAQSALCSRRVLVTRAPVLPPQVPNTPETPHPTPPLHSPPGSRLLPGALTRNGPPLRPPQAPTCSGMTLRCPHSPRPSVDHVAQGHSLDSHRPHLPRMCPPTPGDRERRREAWGPGAPTAPSGRTRSQLQGITHCLARTPGRQQGWGGAYRQAWLVTHNGPKCTPQTKGLALRTSPGGFRGKRGSGREEAELRVSLSGSVRTSPS